jgi:3-deoxy-manno-octulosonate cytidylyltransferase (CMP-KDO synthetase)
MTTGLRIVAVIPAHLASVRFPRKVLHQFHGLPMLEHVRRRAMLCRGIEDVIVATCDTEVADVVRSAGGKVVMTAATHRTGTTRVAEAVANVECSHVVLLQGDEPLLLPRHVEACVDAINMEPEGDAWNVTGPIDTAEELDRHSFVKCSVTPDDRILQCFRRSAFFSPLETQRRFVRKILGIMAFRRDCLFSVVRLPPSPMEEAEFIEQMRMLENGFRLRSVPVSPSLPSVNEPAEAAFVLASLEANPEQQALLDRTVFGATTNRAEESA